MARLPKRSRALPKRSTKRNKPSRPSQGVRQSERSGQGDFLFPGGRGFVTGYTVTNNVDEGLLAVWSGYKSGYKGYKGYTWGGLELSGRMAGQTPLAVVQYPILIPEY